MKNMNSKRLLKGSSHERGDQNILNNKTNLQEVNTMKKLMLVAAMVLGTTAISFAQSSANKNVNVTATVIQGLTLAATGTLGFGTVVAGTTPAALSAQTNGSAPMFTATGDGGHVLTVTYLATASLTGPGTALTFTPSVYGDASSGNQSGSTPVASGSIVHLTGSTGSAGNYYFWLGGALSAIPSSQTPGAYSGTFTLNVSY